MHCLLKLSGRDHVVNLLFRKVKHMDQFRFIKVLLSCASAVFCRINISIIFRNGRVRRNRDDMLPVIGNISCLFSQLPLRCLERFLCKLCRAIFYSVFFLDPACRELCCYLSDPLAELSDTKKLSFLI